MKDPVIKFNWECPVCGSTTIEMEATDVTVYTPILGIHKDCGDIFFDSSHDTLEDTGGLYRYRCSRCGHIICIGRDQDFLDKMVELGAISPDIINKK